MMTKEDIIRMAHEAGLHLATDVNWMPIIDLKYAQKFAELVADAERSACAEVCDLAIEANSYQGNHWTINDCAKAIRARNNT